MSDKSALEQSLIFDVRQCRAKSFVATTMEEINDLIPADSHGEIHRRLMDMFYKNGAAWTTEDERNALGFEPRDNLGWTLSERLEQERQRNEYMLSISNTMIPVDPSEL